MPFKNNNFGNEYAKFIAHTRYKGKTMRENQITIPKGSMLFCLDKVIFYGLDPICYSTSQISMDYFTQDDDGDGLNRAKIIKSIKNKLSWELNSKQRDVCRERWKRVWSSKFCEKFRRREHGDVWLWNYEFYNAPLQELKHIEAVVDGKKTVVN